MTSKDQLVDKAYKLKDIIFNVNKDVMPYFYKLLDYENLVKQGLKKTKKEHYEKVLKTIREGFIKDIETLLERLYKSQESFNEFNDFEGMSFIKGFIEEQESQLEEFTKIEEILMKDIHALSS